MKKTWAALKERYFDSDLLEFLTHSRRYLMSNIALKGIGLISIPIYTRLFTTAEYGLVALYLTYAGLCVTLFTWHTHAAIGRFYYEKGGDFKSFVSTTLALSNMIFLLSTGLFIFFIKELAELMAIPIKLLFFIPFVVWIRTVHVIYQQIITQQKKSKEVATLAIISGYGAMVFAIFFVFYLENEKFYGIPIGELIAKTAIGFFIAYKLFAYLKRSFKIEYVRYIFNYSLPMVPYVISGIVLQQFDRIMINDALGNAQTGLYSFAYNIGMLMSLVISSINTALFPEFLRYLEGKMENKLFGLVKKVFSMEVGIGLLLILFGQEIGMLLGDEKFHESLKIIPIIVMGYVFYAMFTIFNIYIQYLKKNIYSSIAVVCAGALNILLNYIFISKYGYVAAAYTTVISYFFMFLFTWLAVKYITNFKLVPIGNLLKQAFALMCVVIVLLVLTDMISYPALLVTKVILLVAFVAFLLTSNNIKLLPTKRS